MICALRVVGNRLSRKARVFNLGYTVCQDALVKELEVTTSAQPHRESTPPQPKYFEENHSRAFTNNTIPRNIIHHAV